MRNIIKANKVLTRIACQSFLEGKNVSFIDSYHETVGDAEISVYLNHDVGCEIVGYLAINGWNDKKVIRVTSDKTMLELQAEVLDMLLTFRYLAKH